MKKIIFMLLLTTSAMSFAKTEEPKTKESKIKNEIVLVAKKNFKNEKVEIKVVEKFKPAEMNLEGCLAIAFTVATVDPPLGTAMVGSCLETYSK